MGHETGNGGGAPEGDPPLKPWGVFRGSAGAQEIPAGSGRGKAEMGSGRGAEGGLPPGQNPESASNFKQKLSQTFIKYICELSNDIHKK